MKRTTRPIRRLVAILLLLAVTLIGASSTAEAAPYGTSTVSVTTNAQG